MILFLFLVFTEILTFVVLYQHFFGRSREKHLISTLLNVILSIFLWILFIEVATYEGIFDNAAHVDSMLNLAGAVCAIAVPRLLLILCHFTGVLIRLREKEHIIPLTNAGLIAFIIVFSIIVTGTIHGRFNFKTEEITINVKGLNNELDGLKIVQLSDLHLSCFYRHTDLLGDVIEQINAIGPDLIINTGDFVNFGWREYDRFDTILIKARSRFGNFGVLGNHDTGIYHPDFSESDKKDNISGMINMLQSSGYQVLNDTNTIVNIGNAKVGLIGVKTYGRYPHITHGDIKKAMEEMQESDYKILVSHDPNQWDADVTGKTDIGLTFAGHTHGMQMGILTKKFSWSPSKYFYPRWYGLFNTGEQYLYVNRGLGVLAVPFRLWMPPEITVITLRKAGPGI
jgi:predicted MPP superfamily phosphohydrolase